MHLLTVAGNLGAGKTTFIVKLARMAMDAGCRVAILVNEIGEIGIDNQYFRQHEYQVRELLGGCICCSLAADLPVTLESLAADHDCELVLLEPSGAADPANVIAGLEYVRKGLLESCRTMALLDPMRLPMFMQILTPLTTSLIKKADWIVISKTDLASRQELDEAHRIAVEINPEVDIFYHSTREGPDPRLISELLPCHK